MSFIIPPVEKDTSNPILASLFAKQTTPPQPPPVSLTVIDQERVLCKEPFTTAPVSTYAPNSFYISAEKIQNNISTINTIQTGMSEKQTKLLNTYTDLSNNLQQNISQKNYLTENNTKYHFTDQQDPNVILNPQESKDIRVAISEDIKQMKYYQNAMLTASIIAGATILISFFIISR